MFFYRFETTFEIHILYKSNFFSNSSCSLPTFFNLSSHHTYTVSRSYSSTGFLSGVQRMPDISCLQVFAVTGPLYLASFVTISLHDLFLVRSQVKCSHLRKVFNNTQPESNSSHSHKDQSGKDRLYEWEDFSTLKMTFDCPLASIVSDEKSKYF